MGRRKNYWNSRRIPSLVVRLFVLIITIIIINTTVQLQKNGVGRSQQQQQQSFFVQGWEWSDLVVGNKNNDSVSSRINSVLSTTPTTSSIIISSTDSSKPPVTLTIQDVSNLRVRDIKRRLTRIHGYTADEVNKMLDKRELINTLAYEEEKIRLQYEQQAKRTVIIQGILIALLVIVITYCWPLLQQAYEIAIVNWVVFTDRKKYEISQCWEVNSIKGLMGVVAMGIIDLLRFWLTASILLSWVITSRYFFPTPSIPIRASDIVNMATSSTTTTKQQSSSSSSSFGSNFGIDVGPMIIRWVMGFVYHKIEKWTAVTLANAIRAQQYKARTSNKYANETPEERKIRKELKRQRKFEKEQLRQERMQRDTIVRQYQYDPNQLNQVPIQPPDIQNFMTTTSTQPTTNAGFSSPHEIPVRRQQPRHSHNSVNESNYHISNSHMEFMQEMETCNNNNDDDNNDMNNYNNISFSDFEELD